MATLSDTPVREASKSKLATMGVLTILMPYVFVWFIQRPEYPRAFRRPLTCWAIFWCGCAVLYLIVNITTGDQP